MQEVLYDSGDFIGEETEDHRWVTCSKLENTASIWT